MNARKVKAVAGWKRQHVSHGIVLTVQLTESVEAFRDRNFESVSMTMNNRQLRSFVRDLSRSLSQRGIDVFAKPPWWRFWR